MARAFFFGCGIWIAVRDSRKVPKCRNVSLIRTAAATAVSIGAVVILAFLVRHLREGPSIQYFRAIPSTVRSSGGDVKLSWKADKSRGYVLSVDAPLPLRTEQQPERLVTLPANSLTRPEFHNFTLEAKGLHDNPSAKLSIEVAVEAREMLPGPPTRFTIEGAGTVTDAAVDSAGSVYVTGTRKPAVYNPTEKETPNPSSLTPIFQEGFISKFDDKEKLVRTLPFVVGTGKAPRVVVDKDGNAFIAATYEESNLMTEKSSAYLLKFDADGKWAAPWPVGTGYHEAANGVAVDNVGNVYVVGQIGGGSSELSERGYDAFLAKFDSKGNPPKIRIWGSKWNDWASSVAVDSVGNVYVTGYTQALTASYSRINSQAFLAMFDGDLKPVWVKQFGCVDGSSPRIAVDRSPVGKIYVTGAAGNDRGAFLPYLMATETVSRPLNGWPVRAYTSPQRTTRASILLSMASLQSMGAAANGFGSTNSLILPPIRPAPWLHGARKCTSQAISLCHIPAFLNQAAAKASWT